MVEGKGDESAEGGSVHDEKQRTKNGALGTPQEYCSCSPDISNFCLGLSRSTLFWCTS